MIGANCGEIGPGEMSEVVSLLKNATALPVLAQANAGKPKLVDGKTVFEMGPETFVTGMEKCLSAGASLVGGCCGTTPEHIRALDDMLKFSS